MGEANTRKNLPKVTMEQVAKHSKVDDCWIVIRGKVYDMSNYVHVHPGGWLPLANMAGKDATDGFWNYHPAYVWKKLPAWHVADVIEEDTVESKLVSKHRALGLELEKMGLF